MADPAEPLVEHKFCISLDAIKLNNNAPIDCTIKYTYKLFQEARFTTKSFSIDCDKTWKEISESGYRAYIIPPRIKGSEIKEFLDKNPLDILIYDKDVHFGTARYDLSNLMNGKAEMTDFGPRWWKKEPILSKLDSGVESKIGIINCNIVLKSEECTQCKSCKHTFVNSAIKRHLRKVKCRKDYNDEDFKILSAQSLKRRKERESITKKMKYDPQARAKKHKDTYDPNKNKQTYNPQNRAKKYKADMAKSSRNERNKKDDLEMIEKYNQDMTIKMRKEMDAKAKEINSSEFKEASDYFQKCNEALISTNLDEEKKMKIENLQSQLKKKYDQLEIEIEVYADNAKLMKGTSEVSELYRRLMLNNNSRYDDNFLIKDEWCKLGSEIELAFLKISCHVKILTFKSKWSDGEYVPEYDAPKIVLGQHRLIPTQEKCQEEHICWKSNCNASKLYAEFYESKR